jgi:ubiquinone/menaquinone biosynthesis C-methylase UbiE
LAVHPLIGEAEQCYREMKAAHWTYLPQFYGANKQLFSGKAQAYARARPGYPAAAIDYIKTLLPQGAVIADIGAGTGIFTQLLAEAGCIVHAVEPNEDMRSQLVPHQNITIVNASAEDTTLPAQSMDAITTAQALHWFEPVAFRTECQRIAKPGAPVIAIYNNTPGGSSISHSRLSTDIFFINPTVREFPNPINYTREKWLAYMASHSHDPRPGDATYDEHMQRANEIFDRESVEGILRKEVITRVYHEVL